MVSGVVDEGGASTVAACRCWATDTVVGCRTAAAAVLFLLGLWLFLCGVYWLLSVSYDGAVYSAPSWRYDWGVQVDGTGRYRKLFRKKGGLLSLPGWHVWSDTDVNGWPEVALYASVEAARQAIRRTEEALQDDVARQQWRAAPREE